TVTSHRSLSIFFLILPPPPTSTLFPYTTLFRSEGLEARDLQAPDFHRTAGQHDRPRFSSLILLRQLCFYGRERWALLVSQNRSGSPAQGPARSPQIRRPRAIRGPPRRGSPSRPSSGTPGD